MCTTESVGRLRLCAVRPAFSVAFAAGRIAKVVLGTALLLSAVVADGYRPLPSVVPSTTVLPRTIASRVVCSVWGTCGQTCVADYLTGLCAEERMFKGGTTGRLLLDAAVAWLRLSVSSTRATKGEVRRLGGRESGELGLAELQREVGDGEVGV